MNGNIIKSIIFAAVTLAAGYAQANAWWTDPNTGYIWCYRELSPVDSEEVVEIMSVSPELAGDVTIPSSLGGKPVWSIFGLGDCSGLTSVTIPDSVECLYENVFARCDESFFDEMTIPGVKLVNGWAVGSNSSLNGALNLTGIRGIAREAFKGCHITSVTIPVGVKRIGARAFEACQDLVSVTIPDSVTYIENMAFFECTSLKSVTIPGSVKSIGTSAFHYCDELTSVTIGNGVTYIGEKAFYNCSELTSVTIPDSVTSFGPNCFEGCPVYMRNLFRTIFGTGSGSGSSTVVTTVVQQVEAPYALTDHATDRAIASVTLSTDCAIDGFVLKDGKVYDAMLRIVNVADHEVKLTLPSGYVYETFEGVDPLLIPANSRNMLSITRTADNTFLVSREKLKTIQ